MGSAVSSSNSVCGGDVNAVACESSQRSTPPPPTPTGLAPQSAASTDPRHASQLASADCIRIIVAQRKPDFDVNLSAGESSTVNESACDDPRGSGSGAGGGHMVHVRRLHEPSPRVPHVPGASTSDDRSQPLSSFGSATEGSRDQHVRATAHADTDSLGSGGSAGAAFHAAVSMSLASGSAGGGSGSGGRRTSQSLERLKSEIVAAFAAGELRLPGVAAPHAVTPILLGTVPEHTSSYAVSQRSSDSDCGLGGVVPPQHDHQQRHEQPPFTPTSRPTDSPRTPHFFASSAGSHCGGAAGTTYTHAFDPADAAAAGLPLMGIRDYDGASQGTTSAEDAAVGQTSSTSRTMHKEPEHVRSRRAQKYSSRTLENSSAENAPSAKLPFTPSQMQLPQFFGSPLNAASAQDFPRLPPSLVHAAAVSSRNQSGGVADGVSPFTNHRSPGSLSSRQRPTPLSSAQQHHRQSTVSIDWEAVERHQCITPPLVTTHAVSVNRAEFGHHVVSNVGARRLESEPSSSVPVAALLPINAADEGDPLARLFTKSADDHVFSADLSGVEANSRSTSLAGTRDDALIAKAAAGGGGAGCADTSFSVEGCKSTGLNPEALAQLPMMSSISVISGF